MENLVPKQLYEFVDGEYRKFVPQINLNSILESVSEKSIAFIFHHYNHFNATWTNTQELTRAQVPPQLRRNNLWLSYNIKGKRKITERFIGTDIDASVQERWIDSDYWEELDFELLKAGVKQALENVLNNLNSFPEFKEFLAKIIKCILKDTIDPEWLEELVDDAIKDIAEELIQQYIEEYFDSDEFKEYLNQFISNALGDLVAEFFEDIQQALWDEERVIANALARHEMAITELQNQINA